MNKKLMAAAVAGALAIPGMAFAQSSVTLYGTIDGGIRNASKAVSDPLTGETGTVTSATDGLHTTNRWGMKGSEDLGGGLKANFKLEGRYSSDTGEGPPTSGSDPGIFGRNAWVGLSSGGASFSIGKQYTVDFNELKWGDPMAYRYTGIMPAVKFTSGVRLPNMIKGNYSGSGFNVEADYALGEQIGSSSAGAHFGIGGDFMAGPVKVAGAYSTTKNTANTGSQKHTFVGASYDMNQFTFRGGWAQVSNDAAFDPTTDKQRMFMLGGEFRFSDRVTGLVGYYDIKDTGRVAAGDGKKKDTIIGVDYMLSKNTTAYVELDHHALDGAYNPLAGYKIDAFNVRDGATGVGVGIAHSF